MRLVRETDQDCDEDIDFVVGRYFDPYGSHYMTLARDENRGEILRIYVHRSPDGRVVFEDFDMGSDNVLDRRIVNHYDDVGLLMDAKSIRSARRHTRTVPAWRNRSCFRGDWSYHLLEPIHLSNFRNSCDV